MIEARALTLADFLLARITEDETVARNVEAAGEWQFLAGPEFPEGRSGDIHAETAGGEQFTVAQDNDRDWGYGCCDKLDADHIVRWQPYRVLAECEAKRRIITEAFRHMAVIDGEWGCAHDSAAIRNGKCGDTDVEDDAILRALAVVYADHPDYRDEWRAA